MSEDSSGDGSEYRPTDWLASSGLSYGVGHTERQAIQACLRYDGPWDDGDAPVDVSVWELYADSWTSHSPTGPERGAEMLSFSRYEIPLDVATDAYHAATEASDELWRVLDEAEVVEEQANDA